MSLLKQEKSRLNAIIGRNIRLEREARNITISELSKRMGISYSHLGLMERGERGTSTVNLWMLSKVFDLTIDYFFVAPEEREKTKGKGHAASANPNRKKIDALLAYVEDDMSLEFIASTITGVIDLTQIPKKKG